MNLLAFLRRIFVYKLTYLNLNPCLEYSSLNTPANTLDQELTENDKSLKSYLKYISDEIMIICIHEITRKDAKNQNNIVILQFVTKTQCLLELKRLRSVK